MAKGILGIEFELLEEMLRTIVRQEMEGLRNEIKETLVSKSEALLQEERLNIEQVCEFLGVTRHTVYNYIKNETLPEPKRDISDRPYWTPDQLEHARVKKGIKSRFNL